MNLLMCLRIALVGYIVLCKHSESLEDFILGSFGFYSLRVGRVKMHYAWGVQGCSCRTLVNPGTKEKRNTYVF